MKKIIKAWPAVLGAAAGYAYYATIGCVNGTCPITSNPWISAAYGAVIGALLIPRRPASSAVDTGSSQRPSKDEG